MSEIREQLLDRLIRLYGYEHEAVIQFARLCESKTVTDKELETIVSCHEKVYK